MNTRRFLPVLSLLLLAGPAAADLITGQVVDPNGVGVPGVNLDAIDLINGGQATLFNDGADANGFFTTTIPAGVYRIVFKPPAPPTTTLLVVEVNNVVVSGTKNMGTIALPLGVSLGGRTVDVNGFPVANLNVDVIDLGTGQKVPLQGDNTNAFGNFTIAVPTTPIEVQFRTDSISPTLAPEAMELTLSANTNLGDITLHPGFLLSGLVQRSGGSPVSGADTDVLDSLSRVKRFTPNDNTDSSGVFSVVVPAGTFDIEVCPRAVDLLVGAEVLGAVVSGNTDVGVITLGSGVVLSGTITDYLGAPVQGADVDVRDSASGVAVVLCSDNSNASGAYSVVVPTGTFKVVFSPPGECASGLGQDSNGGVVVSGNTVLDGVLPDGTATASVFVGDGINADTITPVAARIGATWSAPLTIGHFHGSSGTVTLNFRPNTFNGPTRFSTIGGRPYELLIGGPLMGSVSGSHNGVSGGIAPGLIPNRVSLVGRSWAAQYTVLGGGFVDLSQAVFGVVGCP